MATIAKSELIEKLEEYRDFVAENATRIFNGKYRSLSKDGNNLNIFDRDRGGDYRRVKLNTLKWIQVGGVKYDEVVKEREVVLTFMGRDEIPLVNEYYMSTMQAHKLLLGAGVEDFGGFGLAGYSSNFFTIDGRSEIVCFSNKCPSSASSQEELMKLVQIRLDEVRKAFSKKAPHRFSIDGVQFVEGRDPMERGALSVPETGCRLATKLLVDNGLVDDNVEGYCAIASTGCHSFAFTANGRTYRVYLDGFCADSYKDFEEQVRSRYQKCVDLIEESKYYTFTIEGVDVKVPFKDASYDTGLLNGNIELLEVLGLKTNIGTKLLSPERQTACFVDGEVEGFDISSYEYPHTPQQFETIVRARVEEVKMERARIEKAKMTLKVVPIRLG